MKLIDYRFSLELTKGGIQKTIHAKSGEGNGRRALITLTESGKVFDLDGCTARVFFEDNTHSNYLAVVGGCFEFVLPSALLESAGEKKCELQLEKNGGVVYSPVFTILVEGSIGGKAYDSVELGEPIRYQEVIQSLPEGSTISNADEIAVYSADAKKTRRVSVSAFAKSTDINAVNKWLDEVDNNLTQVEKTVLGINTKSDQNETGINALGDRVSVIEGYNIPQRFDEVNNRIDNINVSGGGDSIGTSNLQTKDVILDYIEGCLHLSDNLAMTIECSEFPLNARVHRVEIPDFVNGTDEYLALEDMIAKDPERIPYFIMYPKNMTGLILASDGSPMTVVCKVVFPLGSTNNFYVAAEGWNFLNKIIKIYYEIEE